MLNLPFILFALTYLACIGFYNPMGVLSGSMVKMLFCAFSVIAIFWGVFNGRKLKGVYYPKSYYWMIILFMSLSVFMASGFHDQPLQTSIMVTMPYVLSYLMFWSMMKLAVPKEQVINFCLILSLIAIPLYFANVATFPNYMFGGDTVKGEDFSRGILRVPVFSIYIIMMMVFYSVNQVILRRKTWFWIFIGSILAAMVVFSVWRQNIAMTFGLSFIFIFLNTTTIKRVIMIIVAISVLAIVPQIPMFKAMLELSEDQSEANDEDEDIRIYDYKYFCNEAQTNDLTRVFGNGVPSYGNSKWGTMVNNEWDVLGTFAVDTGWAGYYWYYGLIPVICVFVLLLKSACKKKKPDQQYLTYTFIMYILAEIANGAIVYFHETTCIMIALYLMYGPNKEEAEIADRNRLVISRPAKKLTLLDYHNRQ